MMRTFTSIVVAVFASSLSASVLINEIQSSNDRTMTNELGESPDWIELINTGDESVDLSGWGLSDNPSKPFKWAFPDGTVIHAGRYLTVCADSVTESLLDDKVIQPDDSRVIDDLVGWYVADDALESSTEAGRVAVWHDRSDHKNDAFNAIDTERPSVNAGVINGHAALTFLAKEKRKLYLPRETFDGMSDMSNVTVVVVGKWSGLEPVSGGRGLFGHVQEINYTTHLDIYPGGALRVRNGDPAHDVKTPNVVSANNWFCVGFTTDSERETPLTNLMSDGHTVNMITSPIGDVSMTNPCGDQGGLLIGASSLRNEKHFDGEIAEVIIYRRALNVREYASLYRGLQQKYGLHSENRIHTTFSLNAEGETLVLTPKGAEAPVDEISFAKIPCDSSYGRVRNGSWAYFAEATPGGVNSDESFSAPLEAVEFSMGRGVYESPFDLQLSHPDPDARIFYTLDHSAPSGGSGIEYRQGDLIHVEHTTTIRATAIKQGSLPWQNICTHTYVFLEDVLNQQKPDCAPLTWTDEGSTAASYAISKAIVYDDETKSKLFESLKLAPILSVTLDDEELFNSQDGLYCKPVKYLDQEKQASVEWVTGKHVCGMEAGLRMQGNYARRFSESPKKSFRIAFRSRYGSGKLGMPALEDGGCKRSEFNTLVLRGEHNYSWAGGSSKGTSMLDQFVRDLQGEMNGFECHGTYVHLFLNGMYWGLYNASERLDADYATNEWGGEKRDYDVIKNGASNIGLRGFRVRDGSDEDFRDLFDFVLNHDMSDASVYGEVAQRVDLPKFCDYMMLEYFMANTDWPLNNWLCVSSKKQNILWRYMVWDTELAAASYTANQIVADSGSYSSPQKLQRALEDSDEYRILFSDRVWRSLYGDDDGVLTTANLQKRYAELGSRVRPLIFAESARWGAYWHENRNSSTPIFDLATWDAEYNRIVSNFIPNRRQNFFDQLRAAKLYPSYPCPVLERIDENRVSLNIKSDSTIVYYTLDGEDPRVPFEGTVRAGVALYQSGDVITSAKTTIVKARALRNGEWSPLMEFALEGSEPVIVKNEFIPTINGQNWDKNSNWSEGAYPNEAGAWAVIGTPTDVKPDKGWRNIHINKSDVTVGHLEFVSGGCTNRVDTGKSGNLTFAGAVDEDGVAEKASIVVLDESDGSLAIIDLDAPNKVVLATDLDVVINNVIGDACYGGLWLKGCWDGAGHNLAKSGDGHLTLSVTNSPETAFGKIQVAEGSIAITKKLYAEAITKEGVCSAALGSTDLDEAIEKASVMSDKVSVNNVRLFIPTYIGGATWYGAFVAGSLTTTNAKKGKYLEVYVRDDSGSVLFDGKRYRLSTEASAGTRTLEDGRLTYEVRIPVLDVSVIITGDGKEKPIKASVAKKEMLDMLKSGDKIRIKGASEIVVDNNKHEVVIDGEIVSLPSYYNATIKQGMIAFEFNNNAIPVFAESSEGAGDAFVVTGESISLGVSTHVGLDYALQFKKALSDNEWTEVLRIRGDGGVRNLEDVARGGGFYRVMVTDR